MEKEPDATVYHDFMILMIVERGDGLHIGNWRCGKALIVSNGNSSE